MVAINAVDWSVWGIVHEEVYIKRLRISKYIYTPGNFKIPAKKRLAEGDEKQRVSAMIGSNVDIVNSRASTEFSVQ